MPTRHGLLRALLALALLAPVASAQEGALRVEVSPPEREAWVGASAVFDIIVRHASISPAGVSLSATTGPGVVVSFESSSLLVLPDGSAATRATATPQQNATLGEHPIVIHARNAATGEEASALALLRVVPAPEAPRNATRSEPAELPSGGPDPRSEAAPPPREEPRSHSTREGPPPPQHDAPPGPTPSHHPAAPAEMPPPAEPAPAPEREARPPPPQERAAEPPRVRVEPDPLVVMANGSSDLRVSLRVSSAGAHAVRLALPPHFSATPAASTLVALPGQDAVAQFVVRAHPQAAIGHHLGEVWIDGAGLTSFSILVTPPVIGAQSTTTRVEASAPPLVLLALVALGGASWLAARAARRWEWLLAPLYSRIGASQLLASAQRRRILDALDAQPGLCVRELRRRLDMAPGALDHHLRLLEKGGHARSLKDGHRRRWYSTRHPRPAVSPPLSERVLAALDEPARASDLVARLGVPRQAVHYHARRLERLGLLRVSIERGEAILQRTGRA